MSRFYFDVQDGDLHFHDEEGIDLPSTEALRDAAIRALPEMASDALPDGDTHQMVVRVRDANGDYVFEASLSFSSKWLTTG